MQQYQLLRQQEVSRPLERVFTFFEKPENLVYVPLNNRCYLPLLRSKLKKPPNPERCIQGSRFCSWVDINSSMTR